MNVLIITWTFLAACASFVIGVWMMSSADGARWPGVILMIAAVLVTGLGVQLCRERLGRARPRVVVHHEYVYQYPRRRRRPVNATSKKRQLSKTAAATGSTRGKKKEGSQGASVHQAAAFA